MKIIRFRHESLISYGVLEGEAIGVLSGIPFDGINRTGERVSLGDVKLLAPVEPPNVLAIGLNYRKHAAEGNTKVPDHPLLFIKANTTVIGPGETIVLPREAPAEVDYEAELAVIIGRAAKQVTSEEALDYVFGYTCGNDVSARDCQLRLDGQWARGKSFDTFCPLGPWVETDLDPTQQGIRSHLNGELMQDSLTSDMVFDVRCLISFLSRGMTLLPGTVIMTGTPEGVGVGRSPKVFLKDGDTIEVEIEGVGVLQNPVIAEK